jgi:CheY-like chemotaxis protein
MVVGRRSVVFVIDDEESDRQAVRWTLRKWNPDAELRVASDGEEAIAMAETSDTPPDLVLLDLRLPKRDGPEVLAALRRLPGWEGVPIVMATGAASDCTLRELGALGATHAFEKATEFEVQVENLRGVFERWLDQP